MGKIKGALPKFWILHLWRVWYDANKIELLLVFSLTIEDVELNELYWCFVFDGWLWSYFVLTWCQVIYEGLLYLLLVSFDGIYMFEFIEHISYPSEASQISSLDWTLVFQTRTISTLTRVALFDTFIEIFFPKWVFYNYFYVKESIPIDRQVFIHPFDRVWGLVTLVSPNMTGKPKKYFHQSRNNHLSLNLHLPVDSLHNLQGKTISFTGKLFQKSVLEMNLIVMEQYGYILTYFRNKNFNPKKSGWCLRKSSFRDLVWF